MAGDKYFYPRAGVSAGLKTRPDSSASGLWMEAPKNSRTWGKNDGIGQAVGHRVKAAQGVGNGADVAHIGPGEGGARQESRFLHVGPGGEVGPSV